MKDSPLTRCVIWVVKVYQCMRPLSNPLINALGGFQSQCLFSESCSHYSVRVFRERSFIAALGLTARRVFSCIGFKYRL